MLVSLGSSRDYDRRSGRIGSARVRILGVLQRIKLRTPLLRELFTLSFQSQPLAWWSSWLGHDALGVLSSAFADARKLLHNHHLER
jgi:hypothetical protein